MSRTRVLIVDDSVTLRALFAEVLSRSSHIEVVGHAGDAEEAREMIQRLKPDVMTLDVEMPGMNGIDFLEETMRERPMPVVMLSALTKRGAAVSLRALELGAIECFPKPLHASIEEFAKIEPKLTALVRAAAFGRVPLERRHRAPRRPAEAFDWNGRIVAIAAGTGGVDAMLNILPDFPQNCPPAIVTMPLDAEFIDPLVERLGRACAARVLTARDGLTLQQGHVYIAGDTRLHVVVDRWPGPSMRLISSDPVAGARPSASLLFATLAKTAKTEAVGVLLTGMGHDGAAGLKALKAAGGETLVQDPATAMMAEAPAAAIAAEAATRVEPLEAIGTTLIALCEREKVSDG